MGQADATGLRTQWVPGDTRGLSRASRIRTSPPLCDSHDQVILGLIGLWISIRLALIALPTVVTVSLGGAVGIGLRLITRDN